MIMPLGSSILILDRSNKGGFIEEGTRSQQPPDVACKAHKHK